ncbi:MAG TPA: RHS repeat-associated core domain-containing protein [Thermoanaerobaculia bacterium]
MPLSKGRLTKIARSGSEVAYAYDRFGRVTQDGELTYRYDQNGNRAEIGYPGGVTARLTHNFADRDASLEVQAGSAAPQAIVSGARYKPFGPLAGFTFGNGLAEIRSFDPRYFPSRIEVPGRLDQLYSTDRVGNVLSLNRAVGADRFFSTFVYQDPQYFLTEGNGPWGRRAWSYDRIGNRLSEIPPVDLDPPVEIFTYSYPSNQAGGHNPKLSRIEPAPGGEPGSHLDYGYDASGNETTVAAVTGEESGRTSFLTYSAESRLSRLSTSDGTASTELLYDGRGFLRRSRLTFSNSTDFEQTEPTYSSEGLLLARKIHQQNTRGGRGDTGAPPSSRVVMETAYLFYFAGRPVAQLTRPQAGGGADTLLYLTTDHLGTPIQATDVAGMLVWEGGLDPFGTPFVFPAPRPPGEGEDPQEPPEGEDQSAAATATMESAGIFLRFPGQWDDSSFRSHGLRGGLYYNVHRYYDVSTGRYTRPDPIGLAGGENLYVYVGGNPITSVDPTGLIDETRFPTPDEIAELTQRHCARQAILRNYGDMREANWRRSDKYFHCKATCEAARCGTFGFKEACGLGDLREFFDRLLGDPISASQADQAANRFGREEAGRKPNLTCQIICSQYRPAGLPERY